MLLTCSIDSSIKYVTNFLNPDGTRSKNDYSLPPYDGFKFVTKSFEKEF